MWRGTYKLSVIVALLVLSISLMVYSQVDAQKPTPDKWPSFTMVFEEWRYGLGLNGAPGTQRTKLTYDDERHWRMDLLSHSAVPELAGSWTVYNGTEIRHFDSRFGETVTNIAAEDGIHVPAEWLEPYYLSKLLKQANTRELPTPAQGQKALAVTEHMPCDAELTEVERQVGLAPCKEGSRENRREIIFREEVKIPLKVIDTVDNVVVQQITVEELTVR